MAAVAATSAEIALVRPPVVVLPESLATHGPTPPIGLAYVAAALRQAGHPVQLIDAAGEAIDLCIELESPVGVLNRIGWGPREIVDRLDPDVRIVGITNMFLHEWPQVREIANLVRAERPDALVVVGGENGTAFATWILERCAAVDVCVLGEGEATMVELADRVRAGVSYADLPGIAMRPQAEPDRTRIPVLAGVGAGLHADPVEPPVVEPGGVVSNGLPIRIKKKDLDTVPRPAWDLVPLDKYWATQPFFGVDRGRAMQVLGTRGCPYKCSFCSSPQMWTTKYVVRDPEDVVDEIVDYAERFGVENVNFVDLTAATNRRWTLGLCDALEKRAPGVTWQLPVGTRIEAIDREVLQRLWDTGCKNITFAPESGSQRMLEVMNKKADLGHILQAVREANEIGLRTTVNIIVGHPAERWADTWASMRFLARVALAGGDDTAVIMFCPYPGSADFDALVNSGEHVIDEAAFYVGLSRSSSHHRTWNPRMGSRQIRIVQMAMIGAFYGLTVLRRPKRLWEFIRSQVQPGRELTYLDQMVRTKRQRIRPTTAD